MIRFENISVSLGGKPVLRNFDFQIRRKDRILICGKSGIGKSTLFNLLLGAVLPDSGELFFEDSLIKPSSFWSFRRQFSYVPQNPHLGRGPVEDIFQTIFSYRYNESRRPEADLVNSLLAEWELDTNILKKNYEDLSGGEKQRIAITLALALDRSIFLLDEVTSALDGLMKEKVIGHFASKKDATILAISHDPMWRELDDIRVLNLEEVN